MNALMMEFCRQYVKLRDAEKAALAAGYSKIYARKKSFALLNRNDVREEIKRLTERVEQKSVKSATDVVDRLSLIAWVDPVTFLKPDPMYDGQWTFKAPDELTEEQRACVKRVRINKHFNQETGAFIRETYGYELKDPERALENMGRHFGIFDDKLRLTSNQQNPFEGLPTEKIAEIRAAIAKIASSPVKGNLIEHGQAVEQRRTNGNGKGR